MSARRAMVDPAEDLPVEATTSTNARRAIESPLTPDANLLETTQVDSFRLAFEEAPKVSRRPRRRSIVAMTATVAALGAFLMPHALQTSAATPAGATSVMAGPNALVDAQISRDSAREPLVQPLTAEDVAAQRQAEAERIAAEKAAAEKAAAEKAEAERIAAEKAAAEKAEAERKAAEEKAAAEKAAAEKAAADKAEAEAAAERSAAARASSATSATQSQSATSNSNSSASNNDSSSSASSNDSYSAPAQTTAAAPTTTQQAPAAPAASGNAGGAVAFALSQQGMPYIWGATGPSGYDCSGLMVAAYRSIGVSLPRTSDAMMGAGYAVSYDQMVPGDLIISYGGGHVGMYIGNGMMVHAPTSGDVVRTAPANTGGIVAIRRVA